MSTAPEKDILSVRIEGGKVVMSIGVEVLLFALQVGLSERMGEEAEITDQSLFLQAIVDQLGREEEDGSTVIHRAFDEAAIAAVEGGCLGIEFMEDK